MTAIDQDSRRDAPTLVDLLRAGDTVMLASPDRTGAIEARPLTVARVLERRVDILVDERTEWMEQLDDGDGVLLTLSTDRRNTWVSVNGSVLIARDPSLIDELWSPPADAFFDDGRDTPGIAVLTVVPRRATFWSSPSGRLGSIVAMVKAAIGDSDDSGEHGAVYLG